MKKSNYLSLEKLETYKLARKLSAIAWDIYQRLSWEHRKIIGSQFIESTDSVGANIAEGFGRKSDREFRQFLIYANGSSLEVQSALYIALDQKYISKEKFEHLYSTTEEISKMIQNFSKYLSQK